MKKKSPRLLPQLVLTTCPKCHAPLRAARLYCGRCLQSTPQIRQGKAAVRCLECSTAWRLSAAALRSIRTMSLSVYSVPLELPPPPESKRRLHPWFTNPR